MARSEKPFTNDKIHHVNCPKIQAWDCGEEEGIRCQCPQGWPKSARAWKEWYLKKKPIYEPYDGGLGDFVKD